MHSFLLVFSLAIGMIACDSNNVSEPSVEKPEYVLVIHGGAGAIKKEFMSDEQEAQYTAALQVALDAGEKILKAGGPSLDAIEVAIHTMEDNPLFNAGRGAVYTHSGTIEMDASFMDGATGNAGAVAGVQTLRHPVSSARLVMEKSVHVMMSGAGAEAFAISHGLEVMDTAWFRTERREGQLKRIQAKEKEVVLGNWEDTKYGTVGAVALDKNGNLAAATSTGGMTNKRYGRIGDAPIIGAGTFADNGTCAVSCTGHGEYFIRNVVAYDVSARMAYKGISLKQAADEIIMKKLVAIDGSGGLIAVDKNGNIAMPFNSDGMFRGFVKSTGETEIGIYGE
ncbi:isoaspartyl peptidase/L-asparaginase [bacterium]|nr:isoaspartyl peptidase/L-asparaginase [bacterium]